MMLRPGLRLRSQVCTTEIIVVRAPTDNMELDLRCGGEVMVSLGTEVDHEASPAGGHDGGSQLGKRYSLDGMERTLEILVTKGGRGTLAVGSAILTIQQPKPLPSSD